MHRYSRIMMISQSQNQSESSSDTQIWYAVRTFNCQERKVSRYLTQNGYTHFIPMTITVKKSDDEKPKQILVPAIHNLLFVQKKGTEQDMIRLFTECPIPVSIFRNPGKRHLCEIPNQDMIELRMLCDPEYKTSVYMTQTEAEAMIGKEVRVVAGPFKGSVGKLIRKNKHFYFLKAVIGMGVMVRVSRWYCEPI